MTQKLYPFSIRKHGHDLAFRRNRAMNERYDMECNGTLNARMDEQLTALIDALGDIMCTYPDNKGIIWLTGKEYGLAKESVMWAEAMRS